MDSRDYSKTVNTVVMPAATNAFLLSNATWEEDQGTKIDFIFIRFVFEEDRGRERFSFSWKGEGKEVFFLPIKTRMRESLARPFIVAHAERA